MTAETTTAEAGWLRHKTVLMINAGIDVGGDLIAGLLERDAHVALLTDNAALRASMSAQVSTVATNFESRAQVETAFAQITDTCGIPDLLVLSVLPEISLQLKPLIELTDAEWLQSPRAAIRTALYCLQAAGNYLKPRGGAVVFIGPSLALAGCRELVGLSATLEGQRGLMKSVARQWGHTGTTLNWIACAPRALSPLFDAAPLAVKSDAVPVALGRVPTLRDDIVPVLGFLGSAAGRAITGTTLTLDGGEWMLP